MSRPLTQAEIDRASYSPGGAYGSPSIQPVVVQTIAPSASQSANARGRLLYLIGKAREAAAREGLNFTDCGKAHMTLTEMIIAFGALSNELMMATEHSLSTISLAERAAARNEAKAVLGELEALAGGEGPYRGPASRGHSYPLGPADEDTHPELCAICGGPVRWRDVRVMTEFLKDGRSVIDGVDQMAGEVAHVGCWVPRSRVRP